VDFGLEMADCRLQIAAFRRLDSERTDCLRRFAV